MHEAMETGVLAGLDDDEKSAVRLCQLYVEDLLTATTVSEVHREVELDVMRLNRKMLSGTADLVVVHDDGSLDVVDYKFGLTPIDDARDNLQGQCYAMGAVQRWNTPRVTVHFLMPRQGESTRHTFTVHDMGDIRLRLLRIAAVQRKQRKPRNPNPVTCGWCAASGRCPALTAKAMVVSERADLLPVPVVADPSALATVEDRNRAQMLAVVLEEWVKRVKRANMEACRDESLELPDFKLVRRSGSRSILSPYLAAEYLSSKGVSAEQILSCSRIAVGELERMLSHHADSNGWDEDTFVEEVMDEMMQGGIVDQGPAVHYLARRFRGNKQIGEE